MKDAIKVPVSGRNTVIIKFDIALSPMIRDTTENFLSTYPIVLYINRNEIGSV